MQYKMEILDACQEICLDDAGGEANNSNPLTPQWLDKKYAEVLLNKEKIKEEFSQRERSLGIVPLPLHIRMYDYLCRAPKRYCDGSLRGLEQIERGRYPTSHP